ncbi:MAG: 2Fe-2S iron-sulfur cluster-binding protein [Candidatus Bathyarchaeia archaeon]
MGLADITAKVFRFDPTVDRAPRYETYRIPAEEPMTVLTILRFIRRRIDPTISFRDYICYKGICANCMVTVNGKPARGCSTRITPGETVTIEPVFKHPIVKDLVVDFGTTIRGEDAAYIVRRGAFIEAMGQ